MLKELLCMSANHAEGGGESWRFRLKKRKVPTYLYKGQKKKEELDYQQISNDKVNMAAHSPLKGIPLEGTGSKQEKAATL